MDANLIRKPKNARSKRAQREREAKLEENPKKALFALFQPDFKYLIKKPQGILYSKSNEIYPFENPVMFGSHNKKRPHNVIFARFFGYKLLDMIEAGVSEFHSITSFKSTQWAEGSKPCFILQGEEFEQKPEFKKFANIMIDFFRGTVVDSINLAGLDHVIILTATPTTIHFRHYSVGLKNSGTRIPRVELTECGPSVNFAIRRTQFSTPDLEKESLAKPVKGRPRKYKNVTTNVFGEKIGRVHMERQDLKKMNFKKPKALKRQASSKESSSKRQAVDEFPE